MSDSNDENWLKIGKSFPTDILDSKNKDFANEQLDNKHDKKRKKEKKEKKEKKK
jgi:hypothetical protein